MWIKTTVLLLLTALAARGAVINASSASQSDVASAISSASAGDIIMVPSGSANWSGLSIAKAVTLVGAGTNNTHITLTGNNTITKQSAGIVRITGFRFSKNSGGNESKGWTIGGTWPSTHPVVFQTNLFTISATGLFLLDVPGGVVFSRCRFIGAWDDSFIQPKTQSPQNSWSTADTFGDRDTDGRSNHYVEDCDFYGGTNQGIDADDNTRVVYRYNTLLYSSFNTHGMDTSPHGVRHFELYGNQFNHDGGTADIANQNWSVWIRGGTGFIFSNHFANISGSWWGDKPELKFSIRGAEDVRPQGACGNVSYPVPRQLGQSHDGTSYTTDPIRWYGNTGTLAVSAGWNWGNPCGFDFNTFWQQNRDYVIGTAKSGYTTYTYPHPATLTDEPPPDEDPPTVTSRTIGTPGTTLTITFNEAVTFGAGGNGGLTLSASGGAVTPSYSTGSGTSSLVYNLSRTVNAGETVTATYTQPGNGIEDLAGNDLANFTGQSVQNNSTFESDPPTGLTWVQAPTAESGTKVSLQVSATDASALTYYVLMNDASNSWSQSSGTFLLTNLPVAETNFFRFVATDTHGNSATSTYAGTFTMTQTVFTASGTWTAPPGVTNVIAEAWGGGGAGGASGTTRRPGGGGAAYSRSPRVVTPESEYSVWVGSGGSPGGAAAQSSWFDSTNTVRAAGGANASTTAAGAGGTVANSIGTNRFAGGAGGARGDTTQNTGGGGGGSATWSANGSAGGAGGSLGGTGGAGEGPGGAGGAANQPGVSGTAPGGGGGGQGGTASNTSGNGAPGRVILSYFEPPHEPPPVDEDGPELVVNTPASSPLFTVDGTYSALVNATDASGVSSVTATNARGRGPFNGSADGDAWTVPITLLRGRNEIELTARDTFNNTTSTNFVLYYTGPGAMAGTNVAVTGQTRIVR